MKKLSIIVYSLFVFGLLNFSFSDLGAMELRSRAKKEKVQDISEVQKETEALAAVNVKELVKIYDGQKEKKGEIQVSEVEQKIEKVIQKVRFAKTKKVLSLIAKLPNNLFKNTYSIVKKLYPNTKFKASLELAAVATLILIVKNSPLFQDGFCADVAIAEDPTLIQNILSTLLCHG